MTHRSGILHALCGAGIRSGTVHGCTVTEICWAPCKAESVEERTGR